MRIVRFLKDTSDLGLNYLRYTSQYYTEYNFSKKPTMTDVCLPFAYATSYFHGTTKVNLTGFSNADFANSIDDWRSITGYLLVLVYLKHKRAKHIDYRNFFVRNQVNDSK